MGLIAASVSVLPALSSFRVDLVAQLGGGRFVGGSRPVRRFRRGLVVAQVALAVTVVAAAGLLSRSLRRLQGAEMGLAAEQLVFVPLELPRAKYGDSGRLERFLAAAVARLEAAPEVRAATPVNSPPFSGTGGWDAPEFTGEGQSPERASANPSLNFEAVHPSYFATFGITLVRGRTFRATDRWGAPEVVILSEDVAAHAWPGEDPIGKRLKLGNPRSEDPWRTVVGVVGLTRYRELADPRPTLYVPAEQLFVSARTLVLRTAAPLALVAERARGILREVDPQVQVTGVVPFAELLEVPLARPRFDAFLVGVFGLAALLLATVGLYAVVAASVRQRYPEIAVRLALGATAADVRRLVLAEGMWLAVAGAGAGLVAAAASARVMRGLLFDAPAFDPVPLAGAVFLLVGLAALASLLPTRPATRLDVLAVLRRF